MPDRETDGRAVNRRTYLAGSAAVGLLSLGAANGRATGDSMTDRPNGGTVTEIDCCSTITEPGRYALTADLEVGIDETCLEIRATNVILDGRGHTIEGVEETGRYEFPDSDSIGVLVEPSGGKTNGKSSKSGDENGDQTETGSADDQGGVTLANFSVEECGTGIVVRGSTGGRLVETVARENYDGIVLEESSETLLYRNATVDNIVGMRLRSSDANSIVGNRVSDRGDGIILEESRENTLDRNETTGNDPFGIQLRDSDANTITNNTVTGNFAGINCNGARNTIVGNTVTGNVDGIYCGGVTEHTIADNTVRENQYFGIALTDSNDNTVSRNDTTDTDRYAYYLSDSSRNTGRGNTSGSGSIEISGGNGNRIEIDGVWYTEGDATDRDAAVEQVQMQTQPQAITAAVEEIDDEVARARVVEYLEATGRGQLLAGSEE